MDFINPGKFLGPGAWDFESMVISAFLFKVLDIRELDRVLGVGLLDLINSGEFWGSGALDF